MDLEKNEKKLPLKRGKDQEPTEWKSERIRQERRERLQSLKGKDGGKKPIKARKRVWTRVVALVIAVALLLGVGAWALVSFGVPQRFFYPMSVNGKNVSAKEMNLILGWQSLNMFQLPLVFTAENQKLLDEDTGDGLHTYRDLLIEWAMAEVKHNYAMKQVAEAEGYVLNEEDQAELAANLLSLPNQFASQASQVGASLVSYLETTFGPGSTLSDQEAYYKDAYYVNAFIYDHFSGVDVSDERLEAYYEDNADALDMVDYYFYEFKANVADDADEEAEAAALEEAQAKANEMESLLNGSDNFLELAMGLEEDEAALTALERHPNGVHKVYQLNASQSIPTDVRTWLFDAEREAGDSTVIQGTNSSYVVLFEARNRADVTDYSVRHILISADRVNATDEELATARETAEEILDTYNKGDKTEDAFAELAVEHSSDGNAADGGIYEDVPPGQMVSEFESWALDPARKAGDTTIVQSQFGFHIMYFVEHADTPHWKAEASEAVAYDETIAWRDGIVGEAEIMTGKAGFAFVGKSGLFSILFGQTYDPQHHAGEAELKK